MSNVCKTLALLARTAQRALTSPHSVKSHAWSQTSGWTSFSSCRLPVQQQHQQRLACTTTSTLAPCAPRQQQQLQALCRRWFSTAPPRTGSSSTTKPQNTRAPITAPPRAANKAAAAAAAPGAAAKAAADAGPLPLSGFQKWWRTFQTVPTAPKFLGLFGIIPFLAFAPPIAKNLRGILPDELVDNAAAVQVGYGVTILSFLGAVHWGLAMSSSLVGPVGARIANAGFIWSVVPSLLAWPLTAMQPAPAALLLTLFLPMAYLVDYSRRNYLPLWYISGLRPVLTLGATFGCLLTTTYYMHLEYDRLEAGKQAGAGAGGAASSSGGGGGVGTGSAAAAPASK